MLGASAVIQWHCSVAQAARAKKLFRATLHQIKYNVKKDTFVIMMTDRLSNTELNHQSARLAR